MVVALRQLVGQDEAVRRLVSLCARDHVPHALLFEGPESVGKMTAARLLAQVLLCHAPEREPGTACGACPACIKVETGNHADLHVVTTEERAIKIAGIRDAERVLRLKPVEGARKVLLIEDAHRMNPQAQNALLKTLEEPPGASHIILTTARMRAILPTVVSRCQRVPFHPVPTARIAEIVAATRGISEDRAQLAAALAAGSLGKAQAMDLEALLEARDRLATLDRQLERPRPQTAMAALQSAGALGDDREGILQSLDLLLAWLHDQVVLASGAGAAALANADRRDELEAISAERGLARVLERARAVMEARRQLESPRNFNPTMIAEQLCLALAGHARMEVADLA